MTIVFLRSKDCLKSMYTLHVIVSTILSPFLQVSTYRSNDTNNPIYALYHAIITKNTAAFAHKNSFYGNSKTLYRCSLDCDALFSFCYEAPNKRLDVTDFFGARCGGGSGGDDGRG